jgi:hypothetical protein
MAVLIPEQLAHIILPVCPNGQCLLNDAIICNVLFVRSNPRSVTARLITKKFIGRRKFEFLNHLIK